MTPKSEELEGAPLPIKKGWTVPIKYECYACKAVFSYTEVEFEVQNPDYNNRYMTIQVSCKQRTFTSGLGGTGDDYICGACIFKAVEKSER